MTHEHEKLIEELAMRCIAALGQGDQEVVDAVCRDHPEVATEVRRVVGWLQEQGMVSAPADSDKPVSRPVEVSDEVRQLRDPAGRYQFLGEIGRGGIGVVFKGRDTDLGRDVAMKVLRDEFAADSGALARFIEEAQIGGQLQHPGIVPVYDIGLQAGERPYFAMKLIRGETLAAQLARCSDPISDRYRLLGVFEQVCQTMAYAHARHVVHRDLKPANIMIGRFGEVQVVDWGLAKVLRAGDIDDAREHGEESEPSVVETVRSREGSGSQSRAGSVFGTPAYMSPEQAAGETDTLDQRSDVFGLGAILCEILTGDPPYRKADGDALEQAKRAALAPAIERLDACGADGVLIDLCKRCLTVTRRLRPDSAGELAEAVSDHLVSVARRARDAEIAAAKARFRQQSTLVVSAAVVALLLLGAGTWYWLEQGAAARRTDIEQRVAAAITEANGLRGQARTSQLDLGLWAQAVSGARAAVRLADSSDVGEVTRRRANELLDDLEEDQRNAVAETARRDRDAMMLERLETLRVPIDEDVRSSAWLLAECWRLDLSYGEAFAEYVGGDFIAREEDATLADLRDGDIEDALGFALDHWSLVLGKLEHAGVDVDPARTARVRTLSSQIDPGDDWRTRLRSLLPAAAEETERLVALSREVAIEDLSPSAIPLLTDALWIADARQRAIEVLRVGREFSPTDFGLCFRLAVVLEISQEQHREEALAVHMVANALRPNMIEVAHRQGLLFESTGRTADAVRVFRRLVEREPDNGHWRFHLGSLLTGSGEHDAAITEFELAVEFEPERVATYNNLGNAHFGRGDLDEAAANYQRALALDADNPESFRNLGVVANRRGHHDDAARWFERAIRAGSTDPVTYCLLGTCRYEQAREEDAAALFERALAMDPGCAAAHIGLGRVSLRARRFEEAIAHLGRAVGADPNDPAAHCDLGTAHWAMKRFAAAVPWFERALELDPGHLNAAINLGVVQSALGRRDEAIASYRRALAIDPDDRRANTGLGTQLFYRQEWEGAIEHLGRALAVAPDLPSSQQLLGHALFNAGRPEEGIPHMRRAVELEPSSVNYRTGMGQLLAAVGDHEEALEHYRVALQRDPDHGPANMNLAASLLGLGRYRDALDHYRRAREFFAGQSGASAEYWQAHAGKKIDYLEGVVDLEPGLDDYLAWRRVPDTAADWTQIAILAMARQRFTEVVAFTETTLRSAPHLTESPWGLYDSACAAARWAGGSENGLSARERRRIRGLARTWLAGQVAKWQAIAARGGEAAGPAQARLRHAGEASDFAGLRGAALAKLPGDERAAWAELWSSIAGALRD